MQTARTNVITSTTAMAASRRIGRRAWLGGWAVTVAMLAGLGGSTPDAATPAGNDPVTHWNTVAEGVFAPTEGTNPLAQSRTLAILHAAIHDTINAIEPRFAPYTPGLPFTPAASIEAAVAAAAREVLVTLAPEQASMVDAAYARALAPVAEGGAKADGVALGRAAALATLRRRAQDGFDRIAQPAYVPRTQAGDYQFTAPFDVAVGPGLGRVQPFAIVVANHDVPGPLSLTSAEYARDVADVKAIGSRDHSTRSSEQSTIARFWYEDSPLGWNRIANVVIRQQQLDPWASARAFALVNFAMADGFIAGFEAKYRYRFWRPVTAIQAAETDGNPRTDADPSWQPYLVTPPVPDYPSTHTVLGSAAAAVLADLFGEKVRYSTTSLTLPGVTRQYKGFTNAARENGMSRVYAGIHFRHAVEDGFRQGRSIGRAVTTALAPLQ